MKPNTFLRARKVGVAAASTLAVSFGIAGTAAATTAQSETATAATASVSNDTLTIIGTNRADQVTIGLAANPNTLHVDLGGGVSENFDRGTFSAITAFLGNGDDQFTELVPSPDEPLTVDAGNGNDTIATGTGNDLIFGGNGDDVINSGAGDDVIAPGHGDDNVTGGTGHDIAFLEAGNDTFVWNPGDGSDLIDGGPGTDTMQFNGAAASEVMSLSANGQQSVFLRQPGNVRMDMDSVENVNVAALGGADSITINDMTGTDVRQANIDLGGADQQDDTVTVNGTDAADHVNVDAAQGAVDVRGLRTDTQITGAEPTDHLQVNGRDGNDKVSVDAAVPPLIGVGVDLGAGQL